MRVLVFGEEEAFNWLSSEIDKLNLSWQGIKKLLEQAWDEMSLIRGFDYNLGVIKRVFGPTVRRIIAFGKAIGSKILEFIFKGALKLVGAPVEKVMGGDCGWRLDVEKSLGESRTLGQGAKTGNGLQDWLLGSAGPMAEPSRGLSDESEFRFTVIANLCC